MKIHSIRGFNLIFLVLVLPICSFSQKKWGKEDLSVYRNESPFVALLVDKIPALLQSKIIRAFDNKGIIIQPKDLIYFADQSTPIYTPSNSFKLSPSLFEKYQQIKNESFTGIIQLLDDRNELIQPFLNYHFEWVYQAKKIAKVKGFPTLQTLIENPNIIAIEASKNPISEGYDGWIDYSIHQIPAFRNQINFSKIPIISLREGNIQSKEIDLHFQMVEHSNQPQSPNYHSTQMAIIATGAGNSFINALGVVPGAKFITEPLQDFFPLMNDEISSPLQLNSYGSQLEWNYNLEAQAYDDYIAQHKKLFIFSSGNSGATTPHIGPYSNIPQVSNITGNFKQAKNNLLIGGVEPTYLPVSYSSQGPSFDGRIKPELVCFADNGTSSSAAIAVGIATGIYSLLPDDLHRNDLVKSILIAAADDVHLPGIDFKTGYGIINAKQAASITLAEQYWVDEITPGTSNEKKINIPPGNYHIRIALVWNDLPASVQSNKTLVNDLDFYLIKNNEIIHPWVLNATAHLDSLTALATRKKDTLNVVEFITDTITEGNYSIIVDASKITSPQAYSIAYSILPVNRFSFIHPTQEDILLENWNTYVRWNTDLRENGILYYKNIEEEGEGWIQIDSINTNLPIAMFSDFAEMGQYQLKAALEQEEYFSDTFLVQPSFSFTREYLCNDQAVFRISHHSNVVLTYQLQYFDTENNRWVDTKSSNSTIIQQTIDGDYWWRVMPIWNGKSLYPPPAIYVSSTEKICYQGTLLVEGTNQKVDLNFRTWSLNYIESIEFQKYLNNEWKSINLLHFIGEGDHLFSDQQLITGANIYRVKINLKNGESIYTEAQTYFHVEESTFWVYPNPVRIGSPIQVVVKDPLDVGFILYSNDGKVLKNFRVTDVETSITIPSLHAGIYYLVMYRLGNWVGVQKILVQ